MRSDGEEEEGDVPKGTMSALQRLSLSRKKPADSDGSSGAKRAQGIAGLTGGGGRAKMAKQNLAALAPPHVQGATASAARHQPPAPKNKLQALAAQRQAKSEWQRSQVQQMKEDEAVAAAPAAAAPPPMSKLQQRMAAAKAAKETAKSGALPSPSAHTAALEPAKAPEPAVPVLTVSGIAIATLFPTASVASADSGSSLFAKALLGGTEKADDLSLEVPGGSPFEAIREGDEMLKAFAEPSPDDVVLKAREGTRLAARA